MKYLRTYFSIITFLVILGTNVVAVANDHLSPELSQKVDRLAQSPGWLRRLHYQKAFWIFHNRSEIDGQGFFFSPEGHVDPRAEIVASIDAFSKNIEVGKMKLHPQCSFPERYRFLKTNLNLEIKDVSCPKYEEYLNRFNAESASLVFSSSYPNNPGSMFGHTFIQINSKKHSPLLDYGISYAAMVADDENPFLFMWFGLTGGYKGQFSSLPYYSKVNEYINSESRDIWEYELNMTRDETITLLGHVWELENNTRMDYYFFDENCAYVLLKLLAVAKPEWELTHWGPHVIPGETTKELTRIPGAVKGIHFRPSLRKKLMQKYSALNPQELQDFNDLTNKKKTLEQINEPLVIDTTTSYIQYKRQRAGGQWMPGDEAQFMSLLSRRSQLTDDPSIAKRLPPIPEESRPDVGHHSNRLGTASGVRTIQGSNANQMYFQDLHFKFAYHDLMDKDLGFAPYSHIDFPGMVLRFVPQDHIVNIENATFIDVTSLFPLSFLEKKFSWRFAINSYSPKDFGCYYCHVGHFEGGGGITLDGFSHGLVFYTLALAKYDLGNSYSKGYRWGPALQSAVIANPWENYKIKFEGNVNWDLAQEERANQNYKAGIDNSIALSQEWSTRATAFWIWTGLNQNPYSEVTVDLNYYFR